MFNEDCQRLKGRRDLLRTSSFWNVWACHPSDSLSSETSRVRGAPGSCRLHLRKIPSEAFVYVPWVLQKHLLILPWPPPLLNAHLTMWPYEERRNFHSVCSEIKAKETEQILNGAGLGRWWFEFQIFSLKSLAIVPLPPRQWKTISLRTLELIFRLNFKIEFYTMVLPTSKPTFFFFLLIGNLKLWTVLFCFVLFFPEVRSSSADFRSTDCMLEMANCSSFIP